MTEAPPSGCKLCCHIHAKGQACQSPAMSGNDRCYFHAREFNRQNILTENLKYLVGKDEALRRINMRGGDAELIFEGECAKTMCELQFPILEDSGSVQVTLTTVVRALATQQMRARTAGLILYAVQLASPHILAAHRLPAVPDEVAPIQSENEGNDGNDKELLLNTAT